MARILEPCSLSLEYVLFTMLPPSPGPFYCTMLPYTYDFSSDFLKNTSFHSLFCDVVMSYLLYLINLINKGIWALFSWNISQIKCWKKSRYTTIPIIQYIKKCNKKLNVEYLCFYILSVGKTQKNIYCPWIF